MHVLVVDDDPVSRIIFRQTLESAGYTVTEANDGVDALTVMRASQRRLVVLLDVVMPKSNGLSVVLAAMADKKLNKRHSIILVSSSKRIPAFLQHLIDQGTLPFHSKSSSPEMLLEIVEAANQRLQTNP